MDSLLSIDPHVEVAVSLCYSFLAYNALMPEMTNLVKKEKGEKKKDIENEREIGNKKGKGGDKENEKEKDRDEGKEVVKKRKSDNDNEEEEENYEEKKRYACTYVLKQYYLH